MRPNGRLIWGLWGALAAATVIALAVLVSASQAPALGDSLDLGEPLPAISLTDAPSPAATESPAPTSPSPTPTPTPSATGSSPPRTEIVTPMHQPPVRVPAPPDDDDGDDD